VNPHQSDPKSKHLFEDGEIIYNLVVPVQGEHLRVDPNLHQKMKKKKKKKKQHL
jgi:hypothetical protein